ncbi:MAG: hypothetical protein RLO81_03045 [Fulvivirga sp.]|uniref:hypothetical protein n=1 Tax=Fulvivirga sp. TaxID=1931237 RepID=UPI0032EECD6A
MKQFAKIFLIVPVMLLMLHTLVQHKHVSPGDGSTYIQSCQHEIDFFGLIKHAFEIDERENHLEEFEVANSENIDLGILAVISQLLFTSRIETKQSTSWPAYSVSLPSIFYIPNLSFRGPPAQS